MNGNHLRLFERLAPLAALVLLAVPFATAQAQDEERPGEHGDDYAWHADDADAPSEPSRILVTVGGGTSIRIVKNLTLVQDQFAPAFVDVFGAFVFPGSGTWRHGVGLLMSTNLSGDGGDPNGFDPVGQFIAGAEYLAYLRFSDDFIAEAHAGPVFGVSNGGDGGPTVGLEVAFGASYLFLAGLGIYAEASASAFLGASNTVHPIVSLEGGIVIDYEVLP